MHRGWSLACVGAAMYHAPALRMSLSSTLCPIGTVCTMPSALERPPVIGSHRVIHPLEQRPVHAR